MVKKTPRFVTTELCIQYMEKKGIKRNDVSMKPYHYPCIDTIEVLEDLPSDIPSDEEIEEMFREISSRL